MSTTEPPLLRITSSSGVIEIRGPFKPPAGLMEGITAQAHGRLRIASSDEADVVATYVDPTGDVLDWSATTEIGPLLYEEQTYHLWVDGQDQEPLVWHRDPLFVRDITHRPEHLSLIHI